MYMYFLHCYIRCHVTCPRIRQREKKWTQIERIFHFITNKRKTSKLCYLIQTSTMTGAAYGAGNAYSVICVSLFHVIVLSFVFWVLIVPFVWLIGIYIFYLFNYKVRNLAKTAPGPNCSKETQILILFGNVISFSSCLVEFNVFWYDLLNLSCPWDF